MMIKILFFAELQEEIGKNEIIFEHGPITVENLKKELKEKYHLHQIEEAMFAINEIYAQNNDIVSPGDTVAVIPPISGG